MKNEPQITESERQSAIRYLLGAMTDAERSDFEGSSFSRDHSVEVLEAVRDELIDEYLDGELSPADRERFENYFLISPHHLRKVEFTRSLREVVAKTAGPAAPAATRGESLWQTIPAALLGNKFRAAAVACIALMIVCGAAFYVFWRSRNVPIEQPPQTAGINDQSAPTAPGSEAEVNADTRQQTADQNQRPAVDSPARDAEQLREKRGAQTVMFSLHATVRGSDEVRPLIVPAQASAVGLVIDRPADGHASYRALLGTVEGREVWSRVVRKLPPAGAAAAKTTITVPAGLLSSEDYALRITGIKASGEEETVSRYYFRVIKRSTAGK